MAHHVPRYGIKYSRNPYPKLWRVLVVGATAFCSGLYFIDAHLEAVRERMEWDTGDIQFYPLTNPPAIWDEHIKQGLPMRQVKQFAQMDTGTTYDTIRPIRGVEDVEGAPIWNPDKYNDIIKYQKPISTAN